MNMTTSSSFLKSKPHLWQAVDFPIMTPLDYEQALVSAIESSKQMIQNIKKTQSFSFEQTVLPLEKSSWPIQDVSNTFFSLHHAESNDELRKMAKFFSQELSRYSSDLLLDEQLFQVIKACYEYHQHHPDLLKAEEKKLLEETYDDFLRHGALLASKDKERLRFLDQELSRLQLEFSDHVLNDTNQRFLNIHHKNELDGLDEYFIQELHKKAIDKGLTGFLITLDAPTYLQVMKNVHSREIRRQLFLLASSKGYQTPHDNQEHIRQILQYREEKAKLLGHSSYAHYILKKRMAKTPEEVQTFLETLFQYARPQAEKDLAQLQSMVTFPLERWDLAYYSEKLKMSLFHIDDETLRPYFPLSKAVKGLFEIAEKLYNITFIPRDDIPLYHPDVKTYEVKDLASQEHIGIFYTDFFPRPNKKQGAWMTLFKDQRFEKQTNIRPHVSIVCNFTPPQGNKPSLLTLDEVKTLFHEFGHALHGLFSQCQFAKFSGTNVYWDFVELPSQIMENWVTEKECLEIISSHYLTGEPLPEDLREKIIQGQIFQEGMGTLRQLQFAFLDMSWHTTPTSQISDIATFEKTATTKTQLLPSQAGTCVSTSFSHIFSGGYAAGYYSYKWAEVLDADAFKVFKEHGLFNRDIGKKFKTFILEKGGTEHPADLFRKFRGQDPKLSSLLERSGFIG
jgi:peptidyl-dipeptidase Dcp